MHLVSYNGTERGEGSIFRARPSALYHGVGLSRRLVHRSVQLEATVSCDDVLVFFSPSKKRLTA